MKDIETLLTKYFSGEASQEERQAVDTWVQGNEEHAATFQFYKDLWEQSKTAAIQHFDTEQAWETIRPNLEAFSSSRKVEIKSRWPRQLMKVAAALALLVLAIQFFTKVGADPDWKSVAAGHAVEQVLLPDGSIAWLNHGARISYPTNFEGDERQVRLEGEAFFEVASDSSKPFTIYSSYTNVTVLGTSFNFNANQEGAELIVATGKVRFSDKSGKSIILEKGEKGAYLPQQKILLKNSNPNPNYLAWKTGIFEFDGTDIRQVIQSLNQYYQEKTIVIATPSLPGCALSARFEKANIETVLDVLTATCGLQWRETATQFEIQSQ